MVPEQECGMSLSKESGSISAHGSHKIGSICEPEGEGERGDKAVKLRNDYH